MTEKLRKTICQDEGFSKGMAFFCNIDLTKKYYFCHHCQKEHLIKEGLAEDFSIIYESVEWVGNVRCMTSDGRNVNMAEELKRSENIIIDRLEKEELKRLENIIISPFEKEKM